MSARADLAAGTDADSVADPVVDPVVDPSASSTAGGGPGLGRVGAIDVLRGFGMLVVVGGAELAVALCALAPDSRLDALAGNVGGHVAWEGLHFHDWVFPMLVFVTGLTVPFVVTGRLGRGVPRRQVLWRVARRVAVLFAGGLVYNGALQLPGLDQTRIPGVLQRYALAWGGAALVVAFVPSWRRQVAVAAALLVGYWLVLAYVPVPGGALGGTAPIVAAPDLGATGLLRPYTPEGNLAGWVDRSLLQPGQRYETWGDPEGIVSTVPAVGSALLGAVVGGWLVERVASRGDGGGDGDDGDGPDGGGGVDGATLGWLAGSGVAAIALGYLWGRSFPIVKQLWTSSFVVVTTGWAMVALAVCLWCTAHGRLPRLTGALAVVGRNALLVYLASAVVDFGAIAAFFVGGVAEQLSSGGHDDGAAAVLIAGALGVKWLGLWFLDRHDVHLRA